MYYTSSPEQQVALPAALEQPDTHQVVDNRRAVDTRRVVDNRRAVDNRWVVDNHRAVDNRRVVDNRRAVDNHQAVDKLQLEEAVGGRPTAVWAEELQDSSQLEEVQQPPEEALHLPHPRVKYIIV